MIYLASTSPRRLELMKKITDNFQTIKPNFDERKVPLYTENLARIESENKAKSVQNLVEFDDCIISSDTIVVYDSRIFLKPVDEKDAFNTLKFLSGKTHKVITGYAILYKGKMVSKEIITYVTFNELSDELIHKYIKENYLLDKAGSYAIQFDENYNLINNIKGSLDNVIGFPVDEIKEDLLALKVL